MMACENYPVSRNPGSCLGQSHFFQPIVRGKTKEKKMNINDLAVFLESDWFLILVAGVLGAALLRLISRRWQNKQLQADLLGKNILDSAEKTQYIAEVLGRVLKIFEGVVKKIQLPNDERTIVLQNISYLVQHLPFYRNSTPREIIFADVDNLIRCLDKYIINNDAFDRLEKIPIQLGCDILRELKRIPMEGYIGECSFNNVIITIMDKLPSLEDGVRKL